jgi:hypothetical protein
MFMVVSPVTDKPRKQLSRNSKGLATILFDQLTICAFFEKLVGQEVKLSVYLIKRRRCMGRF